MDPAVRWWRANAAALGALVLLVPASVFAFDALEFGAVRNASHSVDAAATTTVGDWTIGPAAITPADPAEVGAPSGSQPVVVTVEVTPGQDEVTCQQPSLIDPASDRRWRTAFDLDWTAADGQQTFCPSDLRGPYQVATIVLLPDIAGGDRIVEFTVGIGDGATDLRFHVDG